MMQNKFFDKFRHFKNLGGCPMITSGLCRPGSFCLLVLGRCQGAGGFRLGTGHALRSNRGGSQQRTLDVDRLLAIR